MTAAPPLHQLYHFLERNRVRLTTILVLLLIIEDIVEGVRPHDLDSLQDFYGLLGLTLVLAGVGIRSWAAGVIHKDTELATQGPYALTRHPLYVGSLLMAIGFCIIIADDENIVFVLLMGFALYFPTIRKEERELSRRFGERWQAYTERTGLLFPKRLPTNIVSAWSFEQWLKNREFRASAHSVLALLILELIHEFQAF